MLFKVYFSLVIFYPVGSALGGIFKKTNSTFGVGCF